MDTPVPQLIKNRAAVIAENLSSALGDIADVMRDLEEATDEVGQSCSPKEFVDLVIGHILNPEQRARAHQAIMNYSVEKLREASVGDMLQADKPYVGSFRAFPNSPRAQPVQLLTREQKFRALYEQLLAAQPPLEGVTGPAWLLCQVTTKGGLKAAGAMREHESGLLVFLVQGKNQQSGDLAQVEYYFDWTDLDSLSIPKVAPTKLVG